MHHLTPTPCSQKEKGKKQLYRCAPASVSAIVLYLEGIKKGKLVTAKLSFAVRKQIYTPDQSFEMQKDSLHLDKHFI